MNQRVVIVDGYSSGRLLGPALTVRGYDCIHVQSQHEIPSGLRRSFFAGDFIENLIYDATRHSEAITLLASRGVVSVIAGCETGVLVADRLANSLGLRANLLERSRARRNKSEMHRVVRASGLRVPRQTTSRDLDLLIRWRRSFDVQRLVLKPTESAGSDGVFVCTSDAEIKNAFNSILGSTNKLLHVNEEVLAQEFVDGVEYVVNTVSCGGRHHIVLVWRYKKNRFGGAVVYDTDTMVDSNDPDFDFDVLEQYTYRLLDSLGITNGPAHSEIMIDSDGPVLIEVGARMDGVVSPVLDARCVGYSQLDLTLDSYLEPDLVSVKTRQGYRLLENAVIVHLIANRAGVVQDIPGASEITRLKSFVEMNLKVSVGGVLCRTLDLFTSPGHVFLASQDRGTLLSDCDKIRGIEGEGRFFSLI